MNSAILDARINHHKQLSSGHIADALNPSRGLRDDIRRKGGQPRNHHRDNLMRIKQSEEVQRLKDKQEETERILSDLERTKTKIKFAHVPSKFKEMKRSTSEEDLSQRMLDLSLPSSEPSRFPSSNHVFVPAMPRKTKMGQLPKYLVDRKESWAKEREAKASADKMLEEGGGPGLVALPESERMKIMRGLEQNMQMTLKELAKFPIAMKTQTQQLRKKELEAKLQSLEKSMERLKRPGKIWIQENSVMDGNFLRSLNLGGMHSSHHQDGGMDERKKPEDRFNPLLGGSELSQPEVRVSRRGRPVANKSEAEENIKNWLS